MATDGTDFESIACQYAHAVQAVLDTQRVRSRPWRSRDPHLMEILQKMVVAIDEARSAARRADTNDAREEVAGLCATLKDPNRASVLSRESAAELLDTVNRAVIRLGDDAYVEAVVRSELRARQADRNSLPSSGAEEDGLMERTLGGNAARAWLLDTLKREGDFQRRRWTRLRLKRRLMWRFAAGMTVAVLATATTAWWAGAELTNTSLAVSAGAMGSAVSGLFKLRDEIAKSRDIVEFSAIGAGQIAVGAAAGIFVLFLVEIGVLGEDGTDRWASVGALAFAAGFSEPFLLGTVGSIAERAPQRSTGGQPESAPSEESARRRRGP
jgi:hypothetical protein